MKKYIWIAFCFFQTLSFGQVTFEEGYYIDNNEIKHEGLIKNFGWKNNPNEILYKKNDSSAIEKKSIAEISEFCINGYSKYVRANVDIDRSSSDFNNLSVTKQPLWSKEQLLLKVLIEAKASLYYFEDQKVRRFFYSVSDSSIKQLVYKEYYYNAQNSLRNYQFRGQLWQDVRCSSATMKSVEYLQYEKKDLVKYFIKFNECFGDTIKDEIFSENNLKNSFNIKVSVGLIKSNYTISFSNRINYSFIPKYNISVGFEGEYILPINRNKWGIFIEPKYLSYSGEKEIRVKYDYDYQTEKVKYLDYTKINFSIIELPIGLRYYFFLNENFKIFLNGAFNFSWLINSHFILDDVNESDDKYHQNLTDQICWSYGAGVDYKRISFEWRYNTSRDFFRGYSNPSSDFKLFSIILKYKLWM